MCCYLSVDLRKCLSRANTECTILTMTILHCRLLMITVNATVSALPTDTLLLIDDSRVISGKERNSIDKTAYRAYYTTTGVLTAEDIEMPLTGTVERRLLYQTPQGEKLILL